MNIFSKRRAKRSRQKFSNRRLVFQNLEQRLALSADPIAGASATEGNEAESGIGGMVHVNLIGYDVTAMDISDPLFHTSANFFRVDLDSNGFAAATGDNSGRDWQGQSRVQFLVTGDSAGYNFASLKIAALPLAPFGGLEPGGGLLPVSTEIATLSNASISEVARTEGESGLHTQDFSYAIAPSRGRAISFQVATVAPPKTFATPSSITSIGPLNHHQIQATTSTVSFQQIPAIAGHDFKELAFDEQLSLGETVGRLPRSVSFMSVSHVSTPVQTQPTPEVSRDLVDVIVQNVNEGEPARSEALETQDTEARSDAFAGWGNRELIAIPLFFGLAVGTVLARRQGTKTTHASRLSTKRPC